MTKSPPDTTSAATKNLVILNVSTKATLSTPLIISTTNNFYIKIKRQLYKIQNGL